MSKKNSENQKRNRQRHEFLLTFFDPAPKYQEKEVNGWYLVKHINGATNLWEVNIYSKEAYEKYLMFVRPSL